MERILSWSPYNVPKTPSDMNTERNQLFLHSVAHFYGIISLTSLGSFRHYIDPGTEFYFSVFNSVSAINNI